MTAPIAVARPQADEELLTTDLSSVSIELASRWATSDSVSAQHRAIHL
jgi:hypothetical protein